MNQIFGQRFIIFEKCRYMGQLLLKLRAVEVATSVDWISSRSTFNNKHTKIAVNSEIRYFEGCSQNKYFKSLKFFGEPTRKWRPCKVFAKLNGNHLSLANISKLPSYQTFCLMNMHNWCKIWFANNIFRLLRWNKKFFSWFLIFQGLSVARICAAPGTILDIKGGLLYNEWILEFVLRMIIIS